MQHYQTIRGVQVPALGFGTWPLKGDECREAVRDALAVGYRHVDTARMYGNEEEVGRGIREGGVPRETIFLTTKLWYTELTRTKVVDSLHSSLRRLQTEYVDLLLVHWPSSTVPLGETMEAMTGLQREGKVRQVGVSNFPPALLREALGYAPVFCNQVEYHPFLGQTALRELCQANDVLLTAYSPIAHGAVVEEPVLQEIGRKYGKSPVQVTLRWLVQQDHVAAIPTAASPDRRRQNFDLFDFELTLAEMEQIFALDRGKRLINPHHAPAW
ncbi:MAG TPA: aldo/keto reductase [Cytophagales bacterium]